MITGVGLMPLSFQLLEEEVVESHKNLLDSMEHWIQQDASLLAMTNEVDYDQDGEKMDSCLTNILIIFIPSLCPAA